MARKEERATLVFRVGRWEKHVPNVTDRLVIAHEPSDGRRPIHLGVNAGKVESGAWTADWAKLTPDNAEEIGRALVRWAALARRKKL